MRLLVILLFPIALYAQLRVSSDGHYLTEQDGTPVLLVGSAPWDINNINLADAKRYADSCYIHRINYWQVRMMSQSDFGGPANAYGVKPWQGTQSFSSISTEAFWAHLDSVIGYAKTKGIYVMLYPDYLGNGPNEGWKTQTDNSTLAQMYAWGQYVGNRYKDCTNVVWGIGGDFPPTAYQTKLDTLVDGIRSTGDSHIISTRDETPTTTNTHWSGYPWLSLRGTYPYWSSYQAELIYYYGWGLYNQVPHLPATLQEAWYENEHNVATQSQLRQQAYYAVLSGMLGGQVFGNCPEWNFGFSDYGFPACGATTWEVELNSQGHLNQKWFSALFNSRYWWKLIPDSTNKVLIAGYRSGVNYVITACASDGSSIVSYFPSQGTGVTINPAILAGDSCGVNWFNPSNGEVTFASNEGTGNTFAVTPPAAGDWVLVVDSKDFASIFDKPGGSAPKDTTPTATGNLTQAWVARYKGPQNSEDRAADFAVDTAGNVYVTGYSVGTGGTADYVTLKCNSDGAQQWAARYNGPGNSTDISTALAVNAGGDVHVTGYSVGANGTEDYLTIKYNNSGVQQWAARYKGPGNGPDRASDVEVDDSGNVYVTGYSSGSSGIENFLTIKYSNVGVQQWVARQQGPANIQDRASDLEVDQLGNVYVAGFSVSFAGDQDYLTVKYNSAGVQQWAARYKGPGNGADSASALALDALGNVYVTGHSVSSAGTENYLTIKYNPAGVRLWAARFGGPANKQDRANALKVDGVGNVYVTGYSRGANGKEDLLTIKYNNAGVRQWGARFKSPGNNSGRASQIESDGLGNVYVTGYSVSAQGAEDYLTIKYNNDGNQECVIRFNGPGNSTDIAKAIAIDAYGNIYVTGTSFGASGSYDFATIKYLSPSASTGIPHIASQDKAGEGEITGDEWLDSDAETPLPTTFKLAQNYPNPFNPSTTIRFDLPTTAEVKLVIYDLRGELIRTLVEGRLSPGYHELIFESANLPSGLYFCHLEAGPFITSRKMVLMK